MLFTWHLKKIWTLRAEWNKVQRFSLGQWGEKIISVELSEKNVAPIPGQFHRINLSCSKCEWGLPFSTTKAGYEVMLKLYKILQGQGKGLLQKSSQYFERYEKGINWIAWDLGLLKVLLKAKRKTHEINFEEENLILWSPWQRQVLAQCFPRIEKPRQEFCF